GSTTIRWQRASRSTASRDGPVRAMKRRRDATAASGSASQRQHRPRLRSAIAPADEPAARSSNAEAADDQSPSSAQPTARSNDSRKASVTPSGGGQSR